LKDALPLPDRRNRGEYKKKCCIKFSFVFARWQHRSWRRVKFCEYFPVVNDLINSLIITMYTTHKHLASDTDIVAETGCGGLYKNCQTELVKRFHVDPRFLLHCDLQCISGWEIGQRRSKVNKLRSTKQIVKHLISQRLRVTLTAHRKWL